MVSLEQKANRVALPDIVMVNSRDQLATLANGWRDCSWLAFDTEFERRTTYYAQLALVQIYDGQSIYLVDPLQLDCPDELRQLLADPQVKIILHSCKEDLEVLYTAWECQIDGLFDTQIAYQFLHGDVSIGYAKLVATMLGREIDKQQTCSDWLSRPLLPEQLNYAAIDVLYLLQIAADLQQDLVKSGHIQWFQQECAELAANAIARVEQPADYRQAKEVSRLNSRQLSLFKRLFEWREQIAKEHNRTKNHIIRDHSLVALAQLEVTTYDQLKKVSDLHPRSVRLYADQWFEIIKQFNAELQGSESHPTLPIVPNPRDVTGLKALSSRLEKCIKRVAADNGIHPTLLFSKRLIRRLAMQMLNQSDWNASLTGWRRELLATALAQSFASYSDQSCND